MSLWRFSRRDGRRDILLNSAPALDPELIKLTWSGHSAFLLEFEGRRIAFDPWLDGDPKAPISLDEFEGADVYAISHSHGNHGFEDAIRLSKAKGGTVVGIFQLANYAAERGAKTIGPNVGGFLDIEGIQISLTQAVHSSELGSPVGFIVKARNLTAYHAGDTGLFAGMGLIGELFSPELAMLPIGGTTRWDRCKPRRRSSC